ncbi:MAG: DegV family protein [Lachnospiraceae bacterium]|nr:DegV family protein [Lachnospiraceae bacterium]
MKKVILSADSTCDLNEELKAKYDVNYYPYHINVDGVEYLDNVTITADEIYQAYWDRKVLPKTSAINVAEYMDYFKKWTDEGYEVVHLCLGGALSSSYQNCALAAEELGGVYAIDSCNLSTGIGHLVVEAGELIKQGLEAREIAERIADMRGKVHSSFILDTLEFMKAGGRCSQVTAFAASILNLKPSIIVDNTSGAMTVGKKYRGDLGKVLCKYAQEKLAEYNNIKTDRIFITHSGIEDEYVDMVREVVKKNLPFKEVHVTKASCTISCHCGPRTLGILFMTE